LSRLAQRTRAALESSLTAVPGVERVLSDLSVPYCVASNGNRAKMSFTLEHAGLLSRFKGRMYCADDVAAPKPAPDLFLHAARECNANPARCTVVEDTPTGVAAALAAGMMVYGFADLTPAARLEEAGAHATFSSMHELPKLLGARTSDA
jgi:HAD superfamily hydrolase (TIGR01509 family)